LDKDLSQEELSAAWIRFWVRAVSQSSSNSSGRAKFFNFRSLQKWAWGFDENDVGAIRFIRVSRRAMNRNWQGSCILRRRGKQRG
jgi:hypothetical protein